MVFLLNHPNEHDVLVWQYFVIPDCKGNINSSFLKSLCHCGCKSITHSDHDLQCCDVSITPVKSTGAPAVYASSRIQD